MVWLKKKVGSAWWFAAKIQLIIMAVGEEITASNKENATERLSGCRIHIFINAQSLTSA